MSESFIFDTFLSHNSQDKPAVRNLADALVARGLRPWLDERDLVPGRPWQEALEKIIQTTKTAAVMFGPAGLGPWEEPEMRAILREFVGRNLPVIPVLLPGAPRQPDLPLFLQAFTWVDLRGGLSDAGLDRLVWGITGKIPDADSAIPVAKNKTGTKGTSQQTPNQAGRARIATVERRGELSDNIELKRYLGWASQEPVVDRTMYPEPYEVQPNDLAAVRLMGIDREVQPMRWNGDIKSLDDFLAEIAKRSSSRKTLLLGEAGVGKSTVCRWLRKELACRRPTSCVPVYVPLGDWRFPEQSFNDFVDEQLRGGNASFQDLLATLNQKRADNRSRYHVILLLDGLNELVATARQQLAKDIHEFISLEATVVLTCRPNLPIEGLCDDTNTLSYEIRRWNDDQMRAFFRKNGAESVLSQMPKEVIDCFKLPLLAFYLILWDKCRDTSEQLPTFGCVRDVFHTVVDYLLKVNMQKNPKETERAEPAEVTDIQPFLEELAHQMTQEGRVHATGREIQKLYSQYEAGCFSIFFRRIINSGLLRCSNRQVALSLDARPDQLHTLKISFLHQSFQEYFTANWITSRPDCLPANVSHDAFWREVPAYMVQGFTDPEKQQEFAFSFLSPDRRMKNPNDIGDMPEHPDYVTAARVASLIRRAAPRQRVQEHVTERLLENVASNYLYPYAIEAFDALGNSGRSALEKCLSDQQSLSSTIGLAESHLYADSGMVVDNEAWCKMGRAVYILSELAHFPVINLLRPHLRKVLSMHLLYHIGDAALTLVRMPNLPRSYRKSIKQMANDLRNLERADALIRGFACTIDLALRIRNEKQGDIVAELREFLWRQTKQCGEDLWGFAFWQRAHGVEVFAELATGNERVELLKALFDCEEREDYSRSHNHGYTAVQTSIVKAVYRSCERYPEEKRIWHDLLDDIVRSVRVNTNGWACRYLERLLLRFFSGVEDIGTIRQMLDTESLGGDRIRKALANVIVYTN